MMGRPRAGDWADEEFSSLAAAGLTTIVSLLEDHEAFELGLAEEARLCQANELAFVSFPIPDRGVPSNVGAFAELILGIHSRCTSGESVVVHCRAGIGRSGVVAAGVLVAGGTSVEEAFRIVSIARGIDVPDTPGQAEWLALNASYRNGG